VIAQGSDQLRGHQFDGSGLVQQLFEAIPKLVWRGAIKRQANAHPVKPSGSEEAQLGEDRWHPYGQNISPTLRATPPSTGLAS